jgi:uncharacterized protein (TIGR00730 family)
MESKKAYEDEKFMDREELRSVKVQLELLRPKIVLDENNIKSTAVIFGSARIDEQKHHMKKWYKKTVKVAKLISSWGESISQEDQHEFVITTGAGPGIMEAGNRGAFELGNKSLGLSIDLPFEQHSNKYVDKELDFLFNYFSIRKMHFLIRAKCAIVMPGGFGTMDELFELLTLIQTKIMEPIPIVLMGTEFWSEIINFEAFAKFGVISEEDLSLFSFTDSPKEALSIVKDFYKK